MSSKVALLVLAAVAAAVAFQAGAATTLDRASEGRIVALEKQVQLLTNALGVSGNGDVTLSAQRLQINAMKAITISGKDDILIKSSKDLQLEAAKDIGLKAGAKAKVESAGTLTLKGASIVQN